MTLLILSTISLFKKNANMSFNNAIKYQLKFKRIIQHGCVGKIALFDKALVVALARVALAMCAMWVGFPSSFFAGGRKKQNKFLSNLHCPVIKLNHFLFQIVAIVSVCSSVFLHLLPTVECKCRNGLRVISYQVTRKVKAGYNP